MKALYEFAIFQARELCIGYQHAHAIAHLCASAFDGKTPEERNCKRHHQQDRADCHERMVEAREHWSRLVGEYEALLKREKWRNGQAITRRLL